MNIEHIASYTEQFYTWEHRGRGWDVYSTPVCLEPRYYPLILKTPNETLEDDGSVTPWWRRQAKYTNTDNKTYQDLDDDTEDVSDAFSFSDTSPLVCLTVSFPKGHSISSSTMEQFIVILSYWNCKVDRHTNCM
jgi:hypothetical protein